MFSKCRTMHEAARDRGDCCYFVWDFGDKIVVVDRVKLFKIVQSQHEHGAGDLVRGLGSSLLRFTRSRDKTLTMNREHRGLYKRIPI